MIWQELTLADLYCYYKDMGWNGSAALIAKQGEEMMKIIKERELTPKAVFKERGRFIFSDTSNMGLWKGEQK